MSKTPNQLPALLNEIRNRTAGNTNTAPQPPAQAPTARVEAPLSVTTQKGEQITFTQQQGQWYAQVARPLSAGSVPVERLPIRSTGDIPQILASLAEYNNPSYRARRVRVVRPSGGGAPFVHVGALGLAGGDDNDPPTPSDQPNRPSSGAPGVPTQRTRKGSFLNMVKKTFKKKPRKSSAPKAPAPKPQQEQEGRSKPVGRKKDLVPKFFQNNDPEPPAARQRVQQRRPGHNPNRNSLAVLQKRIEKEPRIDTTHKLVEALNHSENSSPRAKELRRWFQQYINWFESQSVNSLHDGDLEEFTALASLTADNPKNKKLLRKYLSVLDKKVKDPGYDEKGVMQCLSYSLRVIDPAVFEGDPKPLIDLAHSLLGKLDPEKHEFTPSTHASYQYTFHALHQTLDLIRQVAPEETWKIKNEAGLYTQFRKKLEAIKEKGKKHPAFAYQIEQLLQRLAELGTPLSAAEKNLRRVFYGVKGILHTYRIIRGFILLDIDIKSADWAKEEFDKAGSRQAITKKKWYPHLQTFTQAIGATIKDARQYPQVEAALEKLEDKKITPKSVRKALHLGIVNQLAELTLHSPEEHIRQKSKASLEKLQGQEQWTKDEEVAQAIEEHLKVLSGPAPAPVQAPCRVFRKVKETITQAAAKAPQHSGSTPALPARQHRTQLQARYQTHYARLRNPFGEDREEDQQLSIDRAHFELAILKKPQEQEAQEQNNTKTPKDHIDVLHERSQWEKTPIALGELFKDREVDGKTQPVQKVLLIGSAGLGKTTLTKKLAYQWAQGKHPGFTTVYLLRVRALRAKEYDGIHEEDRLATAIAQECFGIDKTKKAFPTVLTRIKQQLKSEKNLVILDGLDEREGASQNLLEEAQQGKHKLLMTSRPHGVAAYQKVADLEVDLLGLTPAQREDYIKGYFQDKEQARRLLAFLKVHPSFGPMVQVPVTLQMLCALWEADEKQVQGMGSSATELYGRLTEYLWERYKEKHERQERERQKGDKEKVKELKASKNDALKTLGQIAFAGMKSGEALITPKTMKDHADTDIRKIIEESGFLTNMSENHFLEEVGKEYAFAHLTFQEYFAGQELAGQLLSTKRNVQKKATKFLKAHHGERRYERMITFAAGKVYEEEGLEGAQQLLRALNENKENVEDELDLLLLQLRCLNEWLRMDGFDKKDLEKIDQEFKLLESFENRVKQGIVDIELPRKLLRALPFISSVLVKSKAVDICKAALESAPANRRGALVVLREIGKGVPELAPQILPILLKACKGESIESISVFALEAVAKAAPEFAFSFFQKAFNNKHEDFPISALKSVARATPKLADQILLILKKNCSKTQNDIELKRKAFETLGEVSKVLPELVEETLPMLFEGCKDDDFLIHRTVVFAIRDLAKTTTTLGDQIISGLLEAHKVRTNNGHTDSDVYWAIEEISSHVASKLSEKLFPSLSKAYEDKSPDIRRAVVTILKEMAKSKPSLVKQIQTLPILLKAQRDSNWSVCSAAAEALEVCKKGVSAQKEQAPKVAPRPTKRPKMGF